MALIFVTRKIPEAGLTMLREAGHELVISEKDGVLTREELLTAVAARPYEGLLTLLTDTVDAEVLAAAPHATIVSNYAVGFNNIDLSAMAERKVVVTNTPGVLTDTVAEYAFASMLALAKRIPEADRYTRAGKYEGWAPELLLGSDLKGKTLGILGAGRIGSGLAVRAKRGLEMKVIYNDLQPCAPLEAEIDCTFLATPEEVLQQADVVSIHVPLLDSTRHFINAERLAMMKPTAYLINTSRGPVIDEAALVVALQNKTIRGAALDVFEHEPALAAGLTTLDSVVITPHIASASEETRTKMSTLAAENLIAHFAGAQPPHVVEVA